MAVRFRATPSWQTLQNRSLQEGGKVQLHRRTSAALQKCHGSAPGLHIDADLVPVDRGCRGQLQAGQDAVGAIGVVQRLRLGGIQLQTSWFPFHGDELGTQEMAWVAQKAPAD